MRRSTRQVVISDAPQLTWVRLLGPIYALVNMYSIYKESVLVYKQSFRYIYQLPNPLYLPERFELFSRMLASSCQTEIFWSECNLILLLHGNIVQLVQVRAQGQGTTEWAPAAQSGFAYF